jgi:hypothetical protein
MQILVAGEADLHFCNAWDQSKSGKNEDLAVSQDINQRYIKFEAVRGQLVGQVVFALPLLKHQVRSYDLKVF